MTQDNSKPFHVIGIDENDGSATVLHEADNSAAARLWAGRYMGDDATWGGWKHLQVIDTRDECAETLWRWERDGDDDDGRKTIHSIAQELCGALVSKKRDNGERFVCLKDGSPEWMTDVIRLAHADKFPNDWSYAIIEDCMLSIVNNASPGDTADELRDSVYEWADGDVDSYNSALIDWLGSHSQRIGYVDDAIEEYGFDKSTGIVGAIQRGQYAERVEVYQLLIDALEDVANG